MKGDYIRDLAMELGVRNVRTIRDNRTIAHAILDMIPYAKTVSLPPVGSTGLVHMECNGNKYEGATFQSCVVQMGRDYAAFLKEKRERKREQQQNEGEGNCDDSEYY